MKATAPDGVTYTVRRRWWPWRWKERHFTDSWDPGFVDIGASSDLAGAVLGIVLGLVLMALAPIILFLLVTGIEWILLLVLLPVAVATRVVFGRHWTIEVVRDGALWEIDGGSWRESQGMLEQITDQIERGQTPSLDTAVA